MGICLLFRRIAGMALIEAFFAPSHRDAQARSAAFWQNEIPLKNRFQSKACAQLRYDGRGNNAAPLRCE
jgi:hypothetical protein